MSGLSNSDKPFIPMYRDKPCLYMCGETAGKGVGVPPEADLRRNYPLSQIQDFESRSARRRGSGCLVRLQQARTISTARLSETLWPTET